MNISRSLALVLCLGGLLGSVPASADGDPEAGKTKALPCMGCHAIPGYSNVYPTYKVPKLAGQHREYIVAALAAYKGGQRTHKTMVAQAATLSDADMQDIAAYFAAISGEGK
jgi:cytochrome c553